MSSSAVDVWVPAGVVPRAKDRSRDDANEFAVHAGERREAAVPAEPVSPRFAFDDVTFEVLRVHGLTIAEAARFISYRQRRGGRISDVAEIDTITGLSSETRSWLKRHGAL